MLDHLFPIQPTNGFNVSVCRPTSPAARQSIRFNGPPALGQQLLDPAVQVSRQPRENVARVLPGIEPI